MSTDRLMNSARAFVALGGLLVSTLGPAQDLVITNARLIDGLGGEIGRGAIAVSDGVIETVGADVVAPDNAETIDAGGMTVMPGMINAHWHLFAGSGAGSDADLDAYFDTAVSVTLENILERGITTIMSPGDHFPKILEVRRMLRDGELRGPRLFAVGPVFTSPNDWPTQLCAGNEACDEQLNAVVSTPEQARDKVRRLAEAGVDAIKLVYDDMIAPDARIDDAVVTAIADEADSNGLRLYAHLSSTGITARHLVNLGVDAFVHSNIDLTDAIELMRERSVPVNSTTTAAMSVEERLQIADPQFLPEFESYYSLSLQTIRKLTDAGIVVAFGTDSVAGPQGLSSGFLSTTASGEGLFLAEVRSLSRILSNMQIIVSMTSSAAVYLGVEDSLGSLEAGKIADLVFIDGDPLENITDLEHVRVVVQAGKVVVDRR